jgi:hypothetical protein
VSATVSHLDQSIEIGQERKKAVQRRTRGSVSALARQGRRQARAAPVATIGVGVERHKTTERKPVELQRVSAEVRRRAKATEFEKIRRVGWVLPTEERMKTLQQERLEIELRKLT